MLDDFEKMFVEIDMQKAGVVNIPNQFESFEELDDIEIEDRIFIQYFHEVCRNTLSSLAKVEYPTHLSDIEFDDSTLYLI